MWEVFKDWIFGIISAFWSFCGDWGLAIILVTIIFRLLITPLMFSQQKSSYMMKKLQPEVARIKERFPDDPQRQNEETQKIYASAKYNPITGCIPMLIQIPIFMALFQVLRELGDRIEDTATYSFYNLVPNLVLTPGDAFGQGFATFLPYLILIIVFAGATFLPMVFTMKDNPEQMGQMKIMVIVMSLMMVWLGWSSPAGVLLFWGTSSLLAILQSWGSRKYLEHKDKEAVNDEVIEMRPVEVNVKRTQKAKRPQKKR